MVSSRACKKEDIVYYKIKKSENTYFKNYIFGFGDKYRLNRFKYICSSWEAVMRKLFLFLSISSKKIYMFFILLCEKIYYLADKSTIFLPNISDN